MRHLIRSHSTLLALAFPVWLASVSPAQAQTPSITSITPSPAGIYQIITIRGTNLFDPANPNDTVVEFRQGTATPIQGYVLTSASSPSAIYVPVPSPAVGATAPVFAVRVVRGGTVASNEVSLTPQQSYTTPVLKNIYRQGGASCQGTPNTSPATSIFPGQWIALAADGLDQYYGRVTFVSQAGSFPVDSYCSVGDPAIGFATVIQVPNGVGTTGSVQIQIAAGYYDYVSYTVLYTANSNAITLPLTAAPTPPVITSIQPDPASLKQMVTITGSNLMVSGGSTPLVSFYQPNAEGYSSGTVIVSASSANRLFVVLPDLNSYMSPGPMDVQVGNENGTATGTMGLSATPTAPIIRNIYGFTSPPDPNNLCSGTLSLTPLTAIRPGQAIAIAADGISLANNTVTFTATQGSGQVASPCSITNTSVGVAAVVIAPANLSGCSVNIAIETQVSQTPYNAPAALLPSPASAAVTRTLLATSLSSTSLISSLNPSVVGQPVTFSSQVISQLGCSIPAGTITFYDGNTALGTAALNTGALATLTTSNLAIGSHAITARYSGDSVHTVSASQTLNQSVLPPPVSLTGACPGSAPVGTMLRIPLMPSGGTGSYQYAYSGPGWLSLKPGLTSPGMVLEGTPPSTGSFPISVTVSDAGGPSSATFNCVVKVDSPLTMSGACPAPQAVPGTPYSVPVTVSGGSGQYEFFLTGPSWLSLSAKTGTATGGSFQLMLTGTPTTSGTFPISVQVRDVVGNAYIYSNCNIKVAPAGVQITSGCPAPQLSIGSAYSFGLTASGGSAAYTWSIASGALPAGLSLNGNVISGTPQGPGTSAFTIRADSGNLSGQIDCSITVPALPLTLTAACPAQPVVSGTDVSWGYTANGGKAPYQFQFIAPVPQWLTLSSAGAAAKVVGTAPLSGTYPVGVQVSDSDGKSATASCDLAVTKATCPPLELKSATGCPANSVLVGVPYAQDLAASGGKAPYKWNLAGPAFLGLQETGAASARVSGTPPSAGTNGYTVTLTDSCESPAATLSCNLTATAAPTPQISFTVGNLTDPLQQVRSEVKLSQPSPVPLVADLVLTFTPNAFGVTDNPRVQFLDPAATNGGRRLRVTIPAGAVSTQVPVQPDTIAGLIHIELAAVYAGEKNLVTAPYPSTELTVPRIAPVITSLAIERDTGSSFDIVISGYSTPRDMTTVSVTFTAKAGKSIDEPSTVSVQLSDLFRTYYNSAASQAGGSAFTGLRLPVSVSGATDAIGSISVVLTNSAGASKAETRTR